MFKWIVDRVSKYLKPMHQKLIYYENCEKNREN